MLVIASFGKLCLTAKAVVHNNISSSPVSKLLRSGWVSGGSFSKSASGPESGKGRGQILQGPARGMAKAYYLGLCFTSWRIIVKHT